MVEKQNGLKHLSRRDFLKGLAAGGTGAAVFMSGMPVMASKRDVVEGAAQQENAVVTVFMNGNLLTEADSIVEAQMFTIHLMEYNLQDNGVFARYEGVSRTDYDTKVRLLTASGEIDNTVIWSGFGGIANFVKDGILEPLDSLMDNAGVSSDEWIAPTQQYVRYDLDAQRYGDGPTWGLPLWAHAGFAFVHYNADMLAEAGVEMPNADMTWEQVVDLARQVADPANNRWGVTWNPYGNRHDLAVELLYVAPFGGYVLDETGTQCLLNSDECVEAYDFYNRILNEERVSPSTIDHQAFGSYPGGAESNSLAMYRQGGWGANWWMLREENANPTMGLMMEPGSFDGRANGRRGNTMGIDWYGVSKGASNPDATFDVLYWLTNQEAGRFQVDSGNANPAPREDVFNYEGLANNPVAAANAQALPFVDRLPRTHNATDPDARSLLEQRFTAVDVGEAVPDKAWLDQLTGEIQALLDRPAVDA